MALARALAVEPKVLLLDEPFGALDARVRKELRAWLRRLHEEVHVTTVFVTHDQEEAMEVADQIVVMNHGRVEQTAGARELYDEPANEFVMSFVGPVNQARRRLDPAARPRAARARATARRGPPAWSASSTSASRRGSSSTLDDGEELWAQMTQEQAEELALAPGARVHVRPRRARSFA